MPLICKITLIVKICHVLFNINAKNIILMYHSLKKSSFVHLDPRAPQLEETPETPPSSRAEGLLFLHGLESNPGSSLQTEEEAGLP